MKTYNFWFENTRFNKDNPYSGCNCSSLKDAKIWADKLFIWNKDYGNVIYFMVDGGKKIHQYNCKEDN